MKKIIPIVLFIVITAAVIWWVWPDKSERSNNNHPPKPVPFTMTNEKGDTFTVYVSGAIIHGTNVPLTNGNISFYVDPKSK